MGTRYNCHLCVFKNNQFIQQGLSCVTVTLQNLMLMDQCGGGCVRAPCSAQHLTPTLNCTALHSEVYIPSSGMCSALNVPEKLNYTVLIDDKKILPRQANRNKAVLHFLFCWSQCLSSHQLYYLMHTPSCYQVICICVCVYCTSFPL